MSLDIIGEWKVYPRARRAQPCWNWRERGCGCVNVAFGVTICRCWVVVRTAPGTWSLSRYDGRSSGIRAAAVLPPREDGVLVNRADFRCESCAGVVKVCVLVADVTGGNTSWMKAVEKEEVSSLSPLGLCRARYVLSAVASVPQICARACRENDSPEAAHGSPGANEGLHPPQSPHARRYLQPALRRPIAHGHRPHELPPIEGEVTHKKFFFEDGTKSPCCLYPRLMRRTLHPARWIGPFFFYHV